MINKNIHIMKQPELGKRIFQLRKEKGLTQEELVEQCNINVRTIQRIESGEVNPRSYTINIILKVLGEDIKNISSIISSKNKWNKDELKILKRSFVFGMFYIIITLIGISLEAYYTIQNIKNEELLLFRFLYAIPFFILLNYFLKGYKIIAEKFKNTLLKSGVSIYLLLNSIMFLIMIFTKNLEVSNVFEFTLNVLLFVIFGIAELILGIGILKLKEKLGSLAQIIGVLKIVNGCMLITVILSPISLFFMIPVLIFEILFLFNTYNKFEDNHLFTHDDTVHS